MHACDKFIRFHSVTLPTGPGNVDLKDRRLLIGRWTNVVTVVTVSADCSARISPRQGLRMNAFLVRQKRSIADAAALHHCLVSVTLPAGGRNVNSVYR